MPINPRFIFVDYHNSVLTFDFYNNTTVNIILMCFTVYIDIVVDLLIV